jgi:dihydrofolate synthase/folylpolyglutamate synthase
MAERFDALAAISQLPKSGKGPALDRLATCFAALWADLAASGTKVVHVVGSNGKGSTATFLERLLRAQGLRTGLFTSPHYFDFAERIRIDGVPASDEMLRRGWEHFLAHAVPRDAFGSFEAMTVMAAHAFRDAAPNVLIVEAGIGGRLDPTRLFGGTLAVLTSIDIEHAELLGQTEAAIAEDKIDVIGAGGTLVFGWLGAELGWHVAERAAGQGKQAIDIGHALDIDYSGFTAHGTIRTCEDEPVEYRIPAEYFVRNSLLALRAAELLGVAGGGAALQEAYRRLCAEFTLIGRFERLALARPVFCDMAHTPGAIAEVIATCRRVFPAPPRFVLGMSLDKKWPEMCALLAEYGSEFLLFGARHKGERPEKLAEAIRAVRPDAAIRTFADVSALAAALQAEDADTRPVVATGGLFSALEFRTTMTGSDPTTLLFY